MKVNLVSFPVGFCRHVRLIYLGYLFRFSLSTFNSTCVQWSQRNCSGEIVEVKNRASTMALNVNGVSLKSHKMLPLPCSSARSLRVMMASTIHRPSVWVFFLLFVFVFELMGVAQCGLFSVILIFGEVGRFCFYWFLFVWFEF